MKPLHSRPRTPGPLHGSLVEANRSADSQSQAHLQSRLSGSAEPHSASNLFLTGQPKGYYELKKMYGRYSSLTQEPLQRGAGRLAGLGEALRAP